MEMGGVHTESIFSAIVYSPGQPIIVSELNDYNVLSTM